MSYIWCTDIHLDFIDHNKRHKFYKKLKDAEGIICSGDIANADKVFNILKEMYKATRKPIYYVLGNHDYYRGEVDEVRNYAEAFAHDPDLEGNVHYLTRREIIIELRPDVHLIGVDGWACSKAGDFMKSDIRLNDSNYIADLRFAEYNGGRKGLGDKMHELAYNDMCQLEAEIIDTIERGADEIIIVTHVPPFEEACRYQGKATGKDFLPFFCNITMGNMILQQAQMNPYVRFFVLAGHTHDRCHYRKLDNLQVMVGGANYYQPDIELQIFDNEVGE